MEEKFMATKQMLNSNIEVIAHLLSQYRRMRYILQENKHLIDSSESEMLEDWNKAATIEVSGILSGYMPLNNVDMASYPILENVWEKDVKLLKAYFKWLDNGMTGNPVENYFNASNDIRNLLYHGSTYPLTDFKNIEIYLNEKYLTTNGTIDETKHGTHELIKCKAKRIYQTTGNTNEDENWFRARFYIKMFYDNIIPAVMENDKNCIYQVSKAFEFSKSPNNRFLIINSFEAAIAIYFIDKLSIQTIIADPANYVYNMVPVRDWPSDFTAPTKNFKFNPAEKLLTYEGIMDEMEKEQLKKRGLGDEQKRAIEELYWQSHLKPFEAMIL